MNKTNQFEKLKKLVKKYEQELEAYNALCLESEVEVEQNYMEYDDIESMEEIKLA